MAWPVVIEPAGNAGTSQRTQFMAACSDYCFSTLPFFCEVYYYEMTIVDIAENL
jgi:hypothetical protein